MNNNDSYIFGLLMTDGNLYLQSRNRGRIRLEICKKDEDIIDKLVLIIPNSRKTQRTRKTNFKSNYKSVCFNNSRREFRESLINNGFPIKNKTENATIPNTSFSKYDFWRGVIDGDGSIGFTSNKEPFISLITKSEKLKNEYLLFLRKEFNLKKNINRNKRDNCYNIVIKNEEAVMLAKLLYYPGCLGINRKINLANLLQQWKRTKKHSFKRY